MKDGKLGIGILGCGMMGNIHADRWQALPQVRVVAVYDPIEERAAKLAQRLGLPGGLPDRQALLDHPDVDLVSVCNPTNTHAEATLAAIARGKHVLCEKPMARSLPEARSMTTAAAERGVKLGLGFMRRHSPVLPVLRDWLAACGSPALYVASDIRQIRPKLAMHDLHQNGGPALDMAVHLFDLWYALFRAAPVEVHARGVTLGAARPELSSIQAIAPDTAAITARYPSGDVGSFTVSWGLPPGVNPEPRPDQLYTSAGMAEITWELHSQRLRVLSEGGEWQTLAESSVDPYQAQAEAMARWVLDGVPFPATGAEGEVALAAGLQALEAIRQG